MTACGAGPESGEPPVGPTDGGGDGRSESGALWRPAPGTSWQIQLSGTLDTNVDADIYVIDLFDNSAQTISELHATERKVICYFSAGSYEDWRPDADDFPASALGNALDGWPGEWWLDVRHPELRSL